MSFWLLDDGPLGLLARHFDPAWSWPSSTIHVVDEVARAAVLDRSGRRVRLLAMNSSRGEPCVRVHPVPVESEAGAFLYTYLRPFNSGATKDLGEDVAIALCATLAPEAIFVTMDRVAAFIALVELGPGRVATPFDVWADLHRRKLIPRSQYESLSVATLKSNPGLPGAPRRLARLDTLSAATL